MEDESSFQRALLKMKQNLKEKGFHIASLGCNMRCTREISKTKIEGGNNYQKMHEYINTLKSSITGKLPVLILCNKKNWVVAIKEVVCSKAGSDGQNWVILHSRGDSWGSLETSHEIKKELVNSNIFKDIKVYADDKDEKDNECDLEDFVYNSNTVLITESKFFTGCETRNILYLFDDDADFPESMRCSMFRATEQLYIIQRIYGDEPDYKFSGFIADKKYS